MAKRKFLVNPNVNFFFFNVNCLLAVGNFYGLAKGGGGEVYTIQHTPYSLCIRFVNTHNTVCMAICTAPYLKF